jgi:hypothetical protein
MSGLEADFMGEEMEEIEEYGDEIQIQVCLGLS